MKKQTATKIVITTVILGRKNYICEVLSTREADKQKVVGHITNKDEAMEFETEKEATDFIPQIFNQYNRVYEVDAVEVEVKKPVEKAKAELA